jgi:glucokinase
MNKPNVLGIDIGGTHISAALVNLETAQIVQQSNVRSIVDSKKEIDVLMKAWCKVITNAFGRPLNSQTQLGIAMPGPFDYEQGISLINEQNKFRSLYQVNVKQELANRLGADPENIKFTNDAAAFLKGEIFGGVAKGYQNVLGITLGTGLGSSFAKNSEVVDASLWNSPFKNGIAEDYLSTRWFVKRYLDYGGKNIKGVKELAALAKFDTRALKIFTEFGTHLSEFLTTVIVANCSSTVVLGGNIANAYELFENSLTEGLSKNGLSTPIKISLLNEHAALVGAASSWAGNHELYIPSHG